MVPSPRNFNNKVGIDRISGLLKYLVVYQNQQTECLRQDMRISLTSGIRLEIWPEFRSGKNERYKKCFQNKQKITYFLLVILFVCILAFLLLLDVVLVFGLGLPLPLLVLVLVLFFILFLFSRARGILCFGTVISLIFLKKIMPFLCKILNKNRDEDPKFFE